MSLAPRKKRTFPGLTRDLDGQRAALCSSGPRIRSGEVLMLTSVDRGPEYCE